jgi:hypothetical protein
MQATCLWDTAPLTTQTPYGRKINVLRHHSALVSKRIMNPSYPVCHGQRAFPEITGGLYISVAWPPRSARGLLDKAQCTGLFSWQGVLQFSDQVTRAVVMSKSRRIRWGFSKEVSCKSSFSGSKIRTRPWTEFLRAVKDVVDGGGPTSVICLSNNGIVCFDHGNVLIVFQHLRW